MKKINLIVTVFAMLIISSFAMAQGEEMEKQVESQIERTPQKRVGMQEMPMEKGKPCPRGIHSTALAGVNDNLAPANDPVVKSPALTTLFMVTKDFDDQTVNKIFAYSFPVASYPPCQTKTCKAKLLIRVCNSGRDYWQNDKLYIGNAGTTFTPTVFIGTIWTPSDKPQSCKDMTFPISAPYLDSITSLDVVMQDDSTIDYMQLDLDY